MEIEHGTTKKLVDIKICSSFGEARRLQHQMPNKETLEKWIEKKQK